MAAPGLITIRADGTFATTGLQWEGFTRIVWGALSAVGYATPPCYEGVVYEEHGVPRCRVRATVFPHPGHPEWDSLSTELLCHHSVEAVERAALQILSTFSSRHPQFMQMTPLGFFPAADPSDPAWLARVANIATFIDTVRPVDTVQTLTRCLEALYGLQMLSQAIDDDMSYRLTIATRYAISITGTYVE